MERHGAENDLGVMAGGARGTIIIIMMAIETAIEIAIETTIHTAIGVPEPGTGNLAKATTERYPVQRHGVLIASLGHPLSVSTKLGTPSVGVQDAQ